MSGPRKRIQTERTNRGEIVLCQLTRSACELHYEVIINGAFLFTTYNRLSERELARLAIDGCSVRTRPLSILVAGLGAGYTLQAALEHENVGRVTVVEREPTVVDWASTYFSSHNGDALRDGRVSVTITDFLSYIASPGEVFDAVCIDVDNGPHWTVWETNRELYEEAGLKKVRNLLLRGGCLTIWSSRRSEVLERVLSSVFGTFSVHPVTALEIGQENEYVIYRGLT